MIQTLIQPHALMLLLLFQGLMKNSFSLMEVPEMKFEEIEPMPETLNYLERRFKVYFGDYPIKNITAMEYCNQMVRRRHVMDPINICKSHHYFFHQPWFKLESLCEYEQYPCTKLEGNCHLIKKIEITHCELTAGVTYPNCVYSSKKKNKPLVIRCVEAMGTNIQVPLEVDKIFE
ncbi:ribonuclease pancreatic-like [Antechinus flavipes]|uniref:ribonuclease pancreatic-like n=1 Tax=Antechinus flavipes TaxID=38775 RepID=UPI002235CF6F|nr:ribonuclease pancreatic-like [Antechinus flavipes]